MANIIKDKKYFDFRKKIKDKVQETENSNNNKIDFALFSNILNAENTIAFIDGADKMFGLHFRVSTKKQVEEGESLETQESLANGVVKTEKGKVYDIYKEEGVSATKKQLSKRPDMLRLLNDFQQGKFKNIVSYNQDRLFRNDKEAPFVLLYLISNGANIYYTRGGSVKLVNMDTLHEDFGIIEIMFDAKRARKETEATSERVADNVYERFNKGFITQSFLPYAYKRNEENKVVIIDEEAHMIKQIEDFYLNGIGIDTIAKWLNGFETKKLGKRNTPFFRRKIRKDDSDLWTKDAVKGLLFNKFYHGILVNNYRGKDYEERQSVEHEPIRKLKKYEEIINFKKDKIEKKLPPRHYNTDFLLKGLLYCAECGEDYITQNTTKSNGKKYLYYLCRSKGKSDKKVICQNKIYLKELFEEFILLKIKSYLEQLDFNSFTEQITTQINQTDQATKSNLYNLESEIKKIEIEYNGLKLQVRRKLDKIDKEKVKEVKDEELIEDLLDDVEELEVEERDYKKKIKKIRKEISHLKEVIENESKEQFEFGDVFIKMKEFISNFEKAEDYKKKMLIEEIIHKIYVDKKGNIKIEYAIPMQEFIQANKELAVSHEVMFLSGVGELTTPKNITNLHIEESFISKGFSQFAFQNYRFWCEEIYFKAKSNFKDFLIGSTLEFQKDGKMSWWRLHKDTKISQYTAKAYMQNEHFPTKEMFNKVFTVYNKTINDFLEYIEINTIKEELFFEVISCVQTWHTKEVAENEKLKEINQKKLEQYKLPNTLNRMHIYVKKDD